MRTDTQVGMVRRRVVLGVLSCMLVALLALLVLRARAAHEVPRQQAEAPAASTGSSPAPVASGPSSASAAPSHAPAASAAVPQLTLGRPLRVAASGWELAAPAILANDGLEPGKASVHGPAGLTVHVQIAADKGVASALARGGADKQGADIGILPLAELVAGYEGMRALDPQVILVTGWSRGREGLWSQRESLMELPAKGIGLAGTKADGATLLALFSLELAGAQPSSLNLSPGDKGAPMFRVAERGSGSPPEGKLLLTSADAPRLLPIVAVVQAGFVEKHADVLVVWARGWLEGQRMLQQDAADAARRMGALTGAPEALVLVQRFGEIAPAPLYDNARVAGLTGRSPVTLEQLFLRHWQLFREARVLTTPPPESFPVKTSLIAQLVRSSIEPPARPSESKPQTREGQPLLSYRIVQKKPDEAALIAEIGLVAGVFERSVLRLAALGGAGIDEPRTRKLLQTIAERFELPAGRLVAAKGVQGPRGSVVVEVLSVP